MSYSDLYVRGGRSIPCSNTLNFNKSGTSQNQPPLVAGGYLWDKSKHYDGPPRPSIVPTTTKVYNGRLWLETRL
jgi:hypothetical protein